MTLDRRINTPETARGRRLRRQYKSKGLTIPATIGKGDNSNPLTNDGRIWVRRTSSKNSDNEIEYGPPELVNVGVADYWTDNNTKVFLQKDPYYGEWEISRADLRDAKAKNRNAIQLNTGFPQNKYIRLKNVARLICRPVGGNPGTSTLVGVRGLLYDDNYNDLNRFTATARVADKLDLASFIPSAGNHAVVIVHLDTFNNTIVATSSTAQGLATSLDFTDYQEAMDAGHTDYIPIQAFHLADAQTSINNTHLGEDLRQFINMPEAIGNEFVLSKHTRLRANRELILSKLDLNSKNLTIESGGNLTLFSGTSSVVSIDNTDSPYSVADSNTILLCDTTSGNITVTLPATVTDARKYHIKNIGSGTLTIDPNGNTIDNDSSNMTVTQYDAPYLIGDGTEWWLI